MPDALRNNGAGNMEIDLRLQGDKIKLESRPASRESSASSKSAYLAQGPSRPVSAIPILSLCENKMEYETTVTRRPYSADYIRNDVKTKSKSIRDIEEDSSSSLQSLEEIDKDLPSTELLKTLISEPIVSWRNGSAVLESRQQDIKINTRPDNANINNKSVAKSSDCRPPTANFAIQAGHTKNENNPDALQFSHTLSPGLTTKPPTVPKKTETPKYSNRSDMDDRFYNDEIGYKKDIPEIVIDSAESCVKYQNWVEEESNSAEKQTDILLQKLKIQQKELGIDSPRTPKTIITSKPPTPISKESLLMEKLKQQHRDLGIPSPRAQTMLDIKPEIPTDSREDIMFAKFFGENPINLTSEKVITIEKPLAKQSNFKKRDSKKEQIKPKPKITTALPKKPKFAAKTMKSNQDCEPKKHYEVDSWMSRVDDKITSSISSTSEKTRDKKKLMKIEETLEDILGLNDDDFMTDCPEKDNTSANTYDDIADILEVLEAEAHKSETNIQSIKNIVSTELNTAINSIPCKVTKLENEECNTNVVKGVEKGTDPSLSVNGSNIVRRNSYDEKKTSQDNFADKDGNSGNLPKSNNFKNILCFLDEVERSSSQTISHAKERIHMANEMIEGTQIRLDTIPKLEDLLSHTPVELSNEVIDLNLRLKEKSSSIRLLQDELSSVREHVIKISRQTETVVKEKLRTQKEESESIVRRHQKFIDQLIADKKSLNQQCEGLIHEMKVLEDKFNSNMKAAEHRHQVELQKVKDMHVAGEKIRRERWLDSKTQKIKEMTVKSIEPEIQSMTLRHQQELTDLRSLHKREIEDIEMKNARRTQQQCEALRQQLTEEHEKSLAHEREVMRLRYESLVETEEKSCQEQRKRLLQEHSNRMEECEARETAAITEKERCVKQAQDEYEDKLQIVMRRHENEVKMLKETTQLEMETWKSNWRKQQEYQLANREQTIREQCRKERDKEIESVIERLETEAGENKIQLEAATENRIRRMKEKFENEIKDLEAAEKEAKSKYAETKSTLLENEDVVINLRANVKHLETQLKETQDLYENLYKEKSKMKENIKEEMKSEICSLEKEIEKIKNDRDVELQQVYARVKVAVARKDEMLSEISRDHAALKEKCKYLESMLEQQRKEYLIK